MYTDLIPHVKLTRRLLRMKKPKKVESMTFLQRRKAKGFKRLFLGNERLAIFLTIFHKNNYHVMSEVERPAGLPFNSLPGWELIPLYSKLPMLKCPNNQVVFSTNKIGRSYEDSDRDFNAVCLNAKMNYNPLLDKHLRRFYSNEKLLKRLREIGEITDDNDVICTLKEFNEHRLQLQETYISLICWQRMKFEEAEQVTKMIMHAEKIAEAEKKMREKRVVDTDGFGDIGKRQEALAKKQAQRNQVILDTIQKSEQKVQEQKAIQKVVLTHKKELNNIRIKHILDVAVDIQRKKLIALKKNLQFKNERLKRNLRNIKENNARMAKEKAELSWEMHMQERIRKNQKIKLYTKECERMIEEWIENHKKTIKRKWAKIQEEMEKKSRQRGRKRKVSRSQRLVNRLQSSLKRESLIEDRLKNLTTEDIHDALQTAIDLEDPKNLQNFDADDYIYKAAKYILEGILAKYQKDLSNDTVIKDVVAARIRKLFGTVKQYVMKRATHILTSERSADVTNHKQYSLNKAVSFNSFTTLIGTGSYSLNDGDIKLTYERPPTPSGSMTSVVIDALVPPDEANEEEYGYGIGRQRKSLHNLPREDRIFIEHLCIKFKRGLIVGIGKQVLAAIECHKNNKILAVRKELQDIDKEFLVKLMTRSILSYAVNKYNYDSNILLCQHALAGDIILLLQQTLLKPKRDPRCIVQPRSRCNSCLVPPFSSCYKPSNCEPDRCVCNNRRW